MFIPSIEVSSVQQVKHIGPIKSSPDGFILLFGLDHAIRFRLSGQDLSLDRYDICLIQNDADLEIEPYDDEPHTMMVISFRLTDANLRQKLERIGPKLHVDAIYARSCIFNIRNAQTLQPDCVNDYIGYYILSLLFHEYIDQKKPSASPASLSNGAPYLPSSNATIQRILDYIDNHISEEITLHQICDIFLLSSKNLDELFKCEYGCTLMQFVGRFRLFRAKELMCYTNHSITEISGMTGFGSIHYFSRFFKEKERMSPTEYRRLFHQRERKNGRKSIESAQRSE